MRLPVPSSTSSSTSSSASSSTSPPTTTITSPPSTNYPPPSPPRLVIYHQTHYHNNTFISVLPVIAAGATHVIIGAFHIHSPTSIHLNDDPYLHPRLLPLWTEVATLQRSGLPVLGLLGGAAQGSYRPFDGSPARFETYYRPLHAMLRATGLSGLDLDVEEATSLPAIIRLIHRLKTDFGPAFLLTLTPIAPALYGMQNLSGFEYEALEKAFASQIAWYNTQFYCGWGNMASEEDYVRIVARGWDPSRVVAGLVTSSANCGGWVGDRAIRRTLGRLRARFGHAGFGGVAGWEYFNAETERGGKGRPWEWVSFMREILDGGEGDGEDDGRERGEDRVVEESG